MGDMIAEVAKSAVEGLKSNPSCLAAILFAALFSWLIHKASQAEAARRAHTVDVMLERCFPTEGGD